ncbi:MAG: hypothetical protein JKY98_11265 [Gammaproteobacteria bacterium]|nr:hypothetical protein [Gammaproteobacteria bacterium]
MRKITIAVILLIFSSFSMAQVASVNVYQPLPGKSSLAGSYVREAKSIQEAMGARIGITVDLKGIFRYAVISDNWEAFGKFNQSLPGNAIFQRFQNKRGVAPATTQIDNLQLSQVAPGIPGRPVGISQVTVWETTTGTMRALLDGGLGAKPIHEKAGANVTIWRGPPNRMYYITQFENWEAWGKFRDTPNPEFSAYMQSLSANGNGDLGARVVDNITRIHLR